MSLRIFVGSLMIFFGTLMLAGLLALGDPAAWGLPALQWDKVSRVLPWNGLGDWASVANLFGVD